MIKGRRRSAGYPQQTRNLSNTPLHPQWSLPSKGTWEPQCLAQESLVQLHFFAGWVGGAGSVLGVLRAEVASSHSPVRQVVLSFPFHGVIHHGTGPRSQEAGAQSSDGAGAVQPLQALCCWQACVGHTATAGTAGGCSGQGDEVSSAPHGG